MIYPEKKPPTLEPAEGYEQGAKLCTRDGSVIGNAYLLYIQPYVVITEQGLVSQRPLEWVKQHFYQPTQKAEYDDIVRRVLGVDPDNLCCPDAISSRGWRHNGTCPNWVLVY